MGCNPTVDDGKRQANAADQLPGNEEGADIEARQMSKLTLNTSLELALLLWGVLPENDLGGNQAGFKPPDLFQGGLLAQRSVRQISVICHWLLVRLSVFAPGFGYDHSRRTRYQGVNVIGKVILFRAIL